MSTYTVNGVTYSAETGLPVEINEGPSPITSEKPVGVLDGSVVRNKNGTVKNYRFGQTKPYELWSNEDGSSWSIREPESVRGSGSGIFPSEITKSGGTTIVRDGVKTIGYENFLTDELYNKATNDIQTKIGATTLKGVIPNESPTRRDELRSQGFTDKDIDDIFNEEALEKTLLNSEKYQTVDKDGNKVIGLVGGDGDGDNNQGEATTTGDGTDTNKLEFGKVDSIIQKLTLRNLTYPLDADFGNSQDYMQINQFTYRAPNQDLFFPQSPEAKEESNNAPGRIATEGLQSGKPKEKHLGLVKLPMPNSLADSNNVSWGADQLNALTAAVASGVFGQTENVSELIRRAVDRGLNFKNIGATADDTGNLIKKVFGQAGTEGKTILSALQEKNSNISVLGSAVVGSALLNILQFGISPETVLARGQGIVPNNNLALLFNSPTLREFTFTWKLTPRSREEATRVNNIIRFFKQGMAPKKAIGTRTGGASYFLGTPNVFDITFKTTKEGGNFFFEGDDENISVVRIKTCACTGAAVNYTPDGMWNAYDRGQPVSVTLSLRFAELEPIFDTDYDENVFNYDKNRTDLRPVPIDAVGY